MSIKTGNHGTRFTIFFENLECPKGDSGKICYGRGTCSVSRIDIVLWISLTSEPLFHPVFRVTEIKKEPENAFATKDTAANSVTTAGTDILKHSEMTLTSCAPVG